MEYTLNFNPNWASKPGNTIHEALKEKNVSINSFASLIHKTPEFVENLISGNISITNEIAVLLSENLGSTEDFWIKREEQFRVRLNLLQEEEWLKQLPIRDMVKLGWIEDVKDKLTACLNFFNVSNIKEWNDKYSNVANEFAFRTSATFKSDNAATATWLRYGEIRAEESICADWDVNLFEENLLKIRSLTRKKNPKDFLPDLKKYCSECGVSVIVSKTPTGCRASGATKFISDNKALLLLSFRYLSDDQFWFTFFHEAGHLVLHNDKTMFVESNEQIESDEELEANLFSAEILIPAKERQHLSYIRGNKRNIIEFASKLGISPGIVVGQMQHLGYIDYKYLNSYKRRYTWDDINS